MARVITAHVFNNWRVDKQVEIYFGLLPDNLKELIADTLTTWINLRYYMLSKRSQTQESIHSVIQFIWSQEPVKVTLITEMKMQQ